MEIYGSMFSWRVIGMSTIDVHPGRSQAGPPVKLDTLAIHLPDEDEAGRAAGPHRGLSGKG